MEANFKLFCHKSNLMNAKDSDQNPGGLMHACSSKLIPLLTFKMMLRIEMSKIPSVIAKSSLSLYNLATTTMTTAE